MKNFQQTLLVAVALALCALFAYQWHDQAGMRNRVQVLNRRVEEKSQAIQSYTNAIATMDKQVALMDARLTELRDGSKANDEWMAGQKREINKLQVALQLASETITNQAAQYKQVTDTLNAKLKDAYDGVQKQNDAIKRLIAERDEYVQKYNDMVKDRNDVVDKYNELVGRVEKLQNTTGKPADK